MGSFSIPLSGLTAAQGSLQSVSNNLANINTSGFKDQNLTFSSLFSQAGKTNGSGEPLQIGSGVTTSATASNFTEGNLNPTNINSNMALQGNGFFVVQGAGGLQNYTRAGDFTANNAGQLKTPSGDLVLGYPAVNGVVDTSAALQPLQVGSANVPGVTTQNVGITANLSSTAAIGDTASSNLSVYDTLGAPHVMSVTYTKTAANTWSYNVTVPTDEITVGGTGNTTVASGSLNFNTSGVLQLSGTPPVTAIPIAISPVAPATTLAGGAAPMSFNWNLVDAAGNPTITQTATASATSASNQDGQGSGTLKDFAVQPDGTILGTFTSGQTLALGKVAVASFGDIEGLASIGGNKYESTSSSGSAVIGVAGTGGRGTVVGGSVEQSNVDIASEFAKLIVAQQAYSANAKSITTFNQVSQATLAMIQ